MLRERGSRQRVIAFGVLASLCLVLIVLSRTGPVQELRRGVRFAAAPVQEALSSATSSVTDVLGAFSEIDGLRRQNLDLQAEVQRLGEQLATLDALTEENQRLTRLLDVRDRSEFMTVTAAVTTREATQFERVITIDRGTESGIVKEATVLSEGGALAGRVTEVGNGWASVMLISDSRSLVTGLDIRTRATGEVTGRLSAPLAMVNVPVTDKIAVSDRVVTAGIDLGKRFRSAFPKNLVIGRIVDVQQEPGSIVQTALVQPAADLDKLEDVLVIVNERDVRRAAVASATAGEEVASPAPADEDAS